MNTFLPYILPVGILLLMILSAWAVARKVWSSLLVRGKTGSWTAAIAAFVISFFAFAFALVAFAALTFHR